MNNAKTQQYVMFEVDGESYAVEIGAVREVIRMQPITRLPGAGGWIKGVINLRNRLIPVLSLRRMLQLPETGDTTQTRMIIMAEGNEEAAVIVDKVSRVARIDDVQAPPVSSPGLRGVGRNEMTAGLIGIVDTARFFAGRAGY